MLTNRTLSQPDLKQHKALSFWSEPSDILDRVPECPMQPDGQRNVEEGAFAVDALRRGTP
jgi:hypothetical protein